MTFSQHLFGRGARIVLTSGLLLAGCGKEETGKPAVVEAAAPAVVTSAQLGSNGEVVMSPDAPELKQMTIEPVRSMLTPAEAVTATARIEANPHNVAHALAPVPGRITNVMVRLGDTVTRGQTLATIESTAVAEQEAEFLEADTAVRQAETAVRQAELASTKADADLVRLTDLYEHQAVAQKEVLAARTTDALTKASVESAKTSVDQSKQVRDQARRRLELLGLKAGELQQKIVVTAPISGKVMEVNAVEGEYRNEINVPIVTITDLSRVWVTSEVPESQIRMCHVGGLARLELIAYPNDVFSARVTRIADTVNGETRTIKVNAEIDNADGRLRPDMFGNVHYAAGDASAPWIPEGAVVRQNGVDLVFVEQSPGRFNAVPVELGMPYRDGYPVKKGLKAGDRVVTQGAIYLKAAL